MDRQTVLDQLKTDLQKNLNSSNYQFDPNIMEGVTDFDEAVKKPVVAFLLTSDVIAEEGETMDDERERILNILIYGYTNVSLKSYSNLYNLINDLEKFLMTTNHWTYAEQSLLGDVSIWFSEMDFNQAYFTLDLQVYYTQTLD